MRYYARLRGERPGPGDPASHLRRRGRRREDLLSAGPTLESAADHEHLIDHYRALEARGGRAPGPDGVTFADLGPSEVAIVMREAGKAILRGDYRPGPSRKVSIPKDSGGTRILTVQNLVDRVVGAAVVDVLTPTLEATFLPGSYGFRPGRGTWDLLAELEAALIAHQITVLAIDDVRKAFDRVMIAPLMEAFRGFFTDARLLDLAEIVLRGGDDRDRAAGIPQGSPLSPLALNAMLHRFHDVPFDGDVNHPPWFRYADNLAYACRGVPEGESILQRARGLLAPAGLALKGADGPPVDLLRGEAQLLGFRLAFEGGRLRLRPGDGAWPRLARNLTEAHDEPDPPEAARAALCGWIDSLGPAFASKREIARTTEGIRRVGATLGLRELGSTESLRGCCTDAHLRWLSFREGARARRGANPLLLPPSRGVASPPATVS